MRLLAHNEPYADFPCGIHDGILSAMLADREDRELEHPHCRAARLSPAGFYRLSLAASIPDGNTPHAFVRGKGEGPSGGWSASNPAGSTPIVIRIGDQGKELDPAGLGLTVMRRALKLLSRIALGRLPYMDKQGSSGRLAR